ARLGLNESLASQYFDGGFIQDIACVVDHAVLSVAGVRIQGDVGKNAQIGKAQLEILDDSWDQAVRVGGFDAIGGLKAGVNDRKQGQNRDAQFHALLGDMQKRVGRIPN